ncbi:hypothetical protein AB0M36_00640 [Actinoplanes sp. NPDC051346]|uniref:hypothetical protein n=1 Tax=Actinoplanes sp. NPDC051346 TaxID=3155048 RepID=UPI003438B424
MTRVGMALRAGRADPEPGRRFNRAMLGGVAPHLGIAALVLLTSAAAGNGEERAFAIMPVFLEVLLAPAMVVAVVVLALAKDTLPLAKGLITGTGPGLAMVGLLAAGHTTVMG